MVFEGKQSRTGRKITHRSGKCGCEQMRGLGECYGTIGISDIYDEAK
jgi:hypothetical protein